MAYLQAVGGDTCRTSLPTAIAKDGFIGYCLSQAKTLVKPDISSKGTASQEPFMNETFGTYLQKILNRNNLTQRELSRRAKVDHVSLCRMLKPYYQFKPGKTIERLTQAVGCTNSDRIYLYRLAGLVPPELVSAFCSNQETALQILKTAAQYRRTTDME